MSIEVSLTSSELMLAAMAGCMRRIENLYNGGRDSRGATGEDGWHIDVEGAAGEFAVSKALNVHWPGKGRYRDYDAGRLQVRTRSRHHYDLMIYETDADDMPFVLVTGRAPVFLVQGWILGRDGKLDRYWSDPAGGRPAFFVPQEVLRPIEELMHAA